MAVNVNTVYQTVLTILNKEQRGYLDAAEFNNIARVVQREIYESYFLKFMAAPTQGPLVADPSMFLDEKISEFEEIEDILERNDASEFVFPGTLYRIGLVTNKANGVVIDNVSHKDAAYLRRSHLTAPTEKQPIYVIHNGFIKCYPDTDDSSVNEITLVYLREPLDPNLVQTVDMDGDIVTDTDHEDYRDFELHVSELHELVIRICAYAGVVVRAPEVTNFANQVEAKIQGTEQ